MQHRFYCDMTSTTKTLALAAGPLALLAIAAATPAAPALAQATANSDYRNVITNNMRACAPGAAMWR